MIIFGKAERTKVEEIRNELSSDILETYDNAQTFHDGKWVMFNITDYSMIEDFKKLLFTQIAIATCNSSQKSNDL